jgi:hypothetical protein
MRGSQRNAALALFAIGASAQTFGQQPLGDICPDYRTYSSYAQYEILECSTGWECIANGPAVSRTPKDPSNYRFNDQQRAVAPLPLLWSRKSYQI